MSSALAIAAIASTVIGAGVSAAGAAQQGKSAAKLANYNAQIAQNDAIAARQKAEFDAKAQERQAALLQGTQRASIAASGNPVWRRDRFSSRAAARAGSELRGRGSRAEGQGQGG